MYLTRTSFIRKEKKTMGNYRRFTLTTYFVAHAAARVTEAQLEELGYT